MDKWLIAATAATGYIAKQLQNVTKCKDSSEDVHLMKSESPPTSLLSSFVRVKKANENKFGDENSVDVPSTSGENLGNYEDIESDSLFGFPEIAGEKQLSSSFMQITFIKRNQRYRRITKPLSSFESCLMSQFNGEQMGMESYMASPFPSPRASRSLLVTDGARVISKSNADSSWLSQQHKAVDNCGIPKLESLVEKEVGNRKTKCRKQGLSDVTMLLQIGISIGVMSLFMASQTEVSKVKKELKQTENLVDEKAGENSESISNIEAELEAELERLEINMNSSNIETSDMIEMEQDFDETESNQDPSGNSTPEPGNYAVSPRELSLRLHKLINSRLEKRIEELETALHESQMKVEQLVMESESKKKKNSFNNKTNLAEMQPLVMNLTGEALDAFNDSYDELMKITDDSEDDDSPLEMIESSHWSNHKDDSMAQELDLLDFIGLEEEEESSDFESEMEKELIKQIVEKTKQGSAVLLNAQKLLFLMEETDT